LGGGGDEAVGGFENLALKIFLKSRSVLTEDTMSGVEVFGSFSASLFRFFDLADGGGGLDFRF
jgi:hypothetical protein